MRSGVDTIVHIASLKIRLTAHRHPDLDSTPQSGSHTDDRLLARRNLHIRNLKQQPLELCWHSTGRECLTRLCLHASVIETGLAFEGLTTEMN
jgi:hypothetical protein